MKLPSDALSFPGALAGGPANDFRVTNDDQAGFGMFARLLVRFLSQHLHIQSFWLASCLAVVELCLMVLAVTALIAFPIAGLIIRVIDLRSPDEYQQHEPRTRLTPAPNRGDVSAYV